MRIHKPAYRRGDFLRRCDKTGFRRYASETQKEWNNLIVRREEFEPRHPQEFVRGRKDERAVPDARPGPSSDTFIAAGSVVADDY